MPKIINRLFQLTGSIAFAVLQFPALSYARSLPNGSYIQSCVNVYMDYEGDLNAVCKNRLGDLVHTYLSNPFSCSNGVENIDGRLQCSSQSPNSGMPFPPQPPNSGMPFPSQPPNSGMPFPSQPPNPGMPSFPSQPPNTSSANDKASCVAEASRYLMNKQVVEVCRNATTFTTLCIKESSRYMTNNQVVELCQNADQYTAKCVRESIPRLPTKQVVAVCKNN